MGSRDKKTEFSPFFSRKPLDGLNLNLDLYEAFFVPLQSAET